MLYSVLMILAKLAVGGWMLLWPRAEDRKGEASSQRRKVGSEWILALWAIAGGRGCCHGTEDDNFRDEEHDGASAAKETMVQEDNYLGTRASDVVISANVNITLSSSNDLSPARSAALLGLAMVARGEIALIVAQLARGLLVNGIDEEPFAVVIWGILVSTLGGALGVGILLRSWAKL
jgi:hypothetical protein